MNEENKKYSELVNDDTIEVSCPIGWEHLFKTFCEMALRKSYFPLVYTNSFALTKIGRVVIEQVKEKLGGLRIYYMIYPIELDPEIFKVSEYKKKFQEFSARLAGCVDALETLSYQTCEITGNKGQLCIKNYWMKTLCPEKAEELGYVPCKQ